MANKWMFEADGIAVTQEIDAVDADFRWDGNPHHERDLVYRGETKTVNLPMLGESEHFVQGVILLREGSNEYDSRLVRLIADQETKLLRVEVFIGRPAFNAIREIDKKPTHLAIPLREA